MRYKFLKGETTDLSNLCKEDLEFLIDLLQRSFDGEDYFELARKVSGKGAYPIKGNSRVTRKIHDSLLYRVAEDIIDKAGIRQGVILPDKDDKISIVDEIIGVKEASERLKISRSAVIKAAQSGRLKGKKIGHAWAILLTSIKTYKVAQYRVAAGKAAHR